MSESLAQLLIGILGGVATILAKGAVDRWRGNGLEGRVKTLEDRAHKQANATHGLTGRVAVAETNVTNVKESIARIEATLVRMDGKLDEALRR